jgi:aromatic ring hydroxylase
MNRRDAVTRIGLIMGGAVLGAEFFLIGCKNPNKKGNISFSEDEIALLDEIGDTIIPATSTPGAKSIQIGSFIVMMVNDCYDEKNQKDFAEGLSKLNEASKKKNNASFMKSTPEQRTALLNEIDKEMRAYMENKKSEDPEHYFKMMKELTLLGYFTSEIGATKALRYIETPGRYDGSFPYKKGDKAWAT